MKRIYTIVIVFAFLCLNAKAQTPDWLWGRSAPSTGWGEGWDVATDASNNVYFTGTYEWSVTFDTTHFTSYGYQVYIAKYDSLGNLLWVKSPGGNGYAFTCGVATDNFGNSFMAGRAHYFPINFDTDSVNLSGGNDIFVAKYDSSGHELWVKGFGEVTGTEIIYSVATDAIGNCYITGIFTTPTLIFGTDTIHGTNNGGAFLVKLDPNGNVLFAHAVAGGYAVCTDHNGNIYLTGSFGNYTAYFDLDSLVSTHPANFFWQNIILMVMRFG